MIAKIQLM